MSLKQFVWGICCVFGISAGQILFKAAASIGTGLDHPKGILSMIMNGYFCIAILLYGLTTLGWVSLLRVVPLKIAYPLIALAFLIVPILGRFFLNEKLELRTLFGGLLIVTGVYVSVG